MYRRVNPAVVSIDVSEVKLVVERSMQRRRPPASERDLAGTWTLATKDELGRVYFSLTLGPDGSCEIYREEQYRGRFQRVRDNTVRVSVPGMHMDGETILTWSNDDQFSFTLGGMEFTATRR